MSLALFFNNKDPQSWATALQENLPNEVVEIYPNISEPANVTFALCWRPQEYVLENFPNIAVVQSAGAGVDHITKTQKLSAAIQITRIADYNLSNDMWEFLLSTVLVHLKKLSLYQNQQNTKDWNQHHYKRIADTRVSILGLGKIGGFVAEKFASIGFQVNGWSNSEKHIPNVMAYHGQDQLSSVLKETDVLINLLPNTDITLNILNRNSLSQTNAGCYVINVGRGEHLVEQDLISLLDENHLSGALLDVFRAEPLPQDHPFWIHPKINITPHIASVTDIESSALQVAENYKNHLAGLPLKNVVSLAKGY